MDESFLAFIWKFRLYQPSLITTTGESLTVVSTGEQNHNSGPDFFNARIRISDTLWAGNVEIHFRSSDWYRHGHHSDGSYNSVVLHVVYEADCDIMQSDQRTVPTLELRNFMNAGLEDRYRSFMQSHSPIPCSKNFQQVADLTREGWFDRMLVERLEQRSELIGEALRFSNGNYEEAFYQVMAGGFGFHINALPFSMLARVLPLKLLRKHADDRVLCEALVFGQAGFLDTDGEAAQDAYWQELKMHYQFLALKYGLLPLEPQLWKFLRMRPVNFPTIRLSQFISLVTGLPNVFQAFLQTRTSTEALALLNVRASEYWETHYLFGKETPFREKRLGKESAAGLLINVVAPFMFMYGKWKGEEVYCRQAMDLLCGLPAEKNHIIDAWEAAGASFSTAYQTQAALELHKNYCLKKKCLNCSIGTAILKNKLPEKSVF